MALPSCAISIALPKRASPCSPARLAAMTVDLFLDPGKRVLLLAAAPGAGRFEANGWPVAPGVGRLYAMRRGARGGATSAACVDARRNHVFARVKARYNPCRTALGRGGIEGCSCRVRLRARIACSIS